MPIPVLTASHVDNGFIKLQSAREVRESFSLLREDELQRLRAGASVAELFSQRTALLDDMLRTAWLQAGLNDSHACLLAVGGYGRAELFPHSDIDVLVLIDADATSNTTAQVETFISQLWDSGLSLGHSTRSVNECLRLATSDLSVMTSLLEARVLCGERSLWDAVQAPLYSPQTTLWPPAAFLRGKQAEQCARHQRFDDSAYKIEPNIKESPGGLRDWHTLRWLAGRILHNKHASNLVEQGFLTEGEQTELSQRIELLSRIRYALHLLTDRHEDRLLLTYQKMLAAEFALPNGQMAVLNEADEATQNVQVEAFMQRYFRAVLGLERINHLVMQQFDERLFPPQGEPHALNLRFNQRDDMIETRHAQVFLRTPWAMLEIFLLLQQHPDIQNIRASTLRQLQSHVPLIRAEMRNNPHARALFMNILRQPQGVYEALKQMNRLGLLAAYLPAFENIVGRMQFDLFHLYTVDAHTLLVIRNLRRFSTEAGQRENPLAHAIFKVFDKPELLLIAALFHDIAKGCGGQHEILGAEKAQSFCQLHNLPAEDSELVVWLVREHLYLSMIAQQRDLDDPEVIAHFVEWIGSRRKLDALYLLTVADIHATNPNLWSDWRAALLREIYRKTLTALEKGQRVIGLQNIQRRALEILRRQNRAQNTQEDNIDLDAAQALLTSLPPRYILRHNAKSLAWRMHGILSAKNSTWIGLREDRKRQVSELFIYTHDQAHLFAHIANTLDRLDLTIQAAYISTTAQGMIVDDILFLDAQHQPLRDEWVQGDLLHQLENTIQQLDPTQSTAPSLSFRRSSPLLRHFHLPTRINMEIDKHGECTRVELETVDRPGLLARIGSVLAEQGVDLRGAAINTQGEKAIDTLYISVREPETGRPIPLNAPQRQMLEERLRRALMPT
jgi:[protein-PII] uridylyltransferase